MDLAKAKERIKDLQGISKANEKEVGDLTVAQEEYRKSKESELDNLKRDLASAQQLAQMKKEMLDELSKELTSHRSDQEKVVSDLKSKVVRLESCLQSSEDLAEAGKMRCESLTKEIKSYRDEATTAQINYERELALHSAAQSNLRSVSAEKEEEALLRQTAESQLYTIKLEVINEKDLGRS